MNFELNEQQLSIQKMARDFTEKKVAPKVLERDETREYDVNLYKDLCDMGFIGLPYAKEYGGQGLGYMEYALAVERDLQSGPLPGCLFLRCHLSVWRQPVLLRGHR
ncbi:MAG: acyl-CoA dehydrogenase family protein [Evtepia gabavorous]